jgi:hypothetical protein
VLQNGYRIQVNVDRVANQVEWALVHPTYQSLFKTSIPELMRKKVLRPVVSLYANLNQVVRFT